VAKGIRFAADNGAKVINLSLGGTSDSATLKNAVAYAYRKGVTVVAACGNDNGAKCLYPAAYDDYVIAVGATQYDETKAPYSNYGPSLDIVAPGGNNDLDQNGDGYADGVLQQTFRSSFAVCDFAYYFFQGTSMATPHVSGVAALLIANGNATTPDEVRAALQETAEDLGTAGRDDTFGYGLVDAYAALKWTAVSK
ncbi:MAG: S8 family serine peptidase, partial [Patescibacteria group bacterium]|nr:S8 family serine peptidase [Patescibacteria group bacterium]